MVYSHNICGYLYIMSIYIFVLCQCEHTNLIIQRVQHTFSVCNIPMSDKSMMWLTLPNKICMHKKAFTRCNYSMPAQMYQVGLNLLSAGLPNGQIYHWQMPSMPDGLSSTGTGSKILSVSMIWSSNILCL